ncbi:MAG: hypothetical protein KKI02_12245 [Planctomycetes bacterium]|nr:hypothetical protein [Planctomycetota bacterium]
MRNLGVWVSSFVLLASAALYLAQPAAAVPIQDTSAFAGDADRPLVEPPGEPEDRPPPPPAVDDEPPRPPDQGGRMGPGGRGAWGRGGGPFGRGDGACGPRRPRHFQLMERLLPLIAQDHPDLAHRLVQLRDKAPQEFERVLGDALAIRFEEALARRGQRPMPPGGPQPSDGPGGPEWVDPQLRSDPVAQFFAHKTRELERRNEELERRSMELVERYNEQRQRCEPEAHVERDELRRRIEETVAEHFNVRTELREIELRRVEMELDRLRQMVERIRDDVKRREQARGSITERRLRQLLGEEGGAW